MNIIGKVYIFITAKLMFIVKKRMAKKDLFQTLLAHVSIKTENFRIADNSQMLVEPNKVKYETQ